MYDMNRDGHHTFQLYPTYAHLTAIDDETKEQFRDVLSEPNTGLIEMARLLFLQHEGFYRAKQDFENYHKEPTCIFDLGRYSFHAWRRGGYVYVTWAMFNRPYDWEALTHWAHLKQVSEMMNEIKSRSY